MTKNRRLFWRLFPSFLLVVLASIAVTGALFVFSIGNEHHPNQDQRVITRLHILKEILHPWLANSVPSSVDSLCKRLGDVDGFRVTIILPSGKIVGDSERKTEQLPSVVKRAEFLEALKGKTGKDVRIDAMSQRKMLFVAEPIYRISKADSMVIGVLRLSASVESQGYIAKKVYRAMALASLLAIALVALVIAGNSRRITQKVDALTRWTHDRESVDLTQAVTIGTAGEFANLYRALDKMSLELDGEISEAARERDEQLAVIQSMSEGVIALDMQEKIVSSNRVAREWFSIEKNELTGLTLQETARNSDLERIVRLVFLNQTDDTIEGELALPDGRIILVQGVPLRDETNRRMGVVIMLHDVSELRKLESIRREFVANVSHELKTPITSIKGYIETLLLDGESLSSDHLKFLGIVSAQSNRLVEIIDDLLVLSRIEQGSEIEYETVSVGIVVNAAMSICQEQADEREIRVKATISDGLTLSGNSRLLEQALANLLDNAIKYSSPDSTVRIEAEEIIDERRAEVILRVSDQGAGIAEKHLPRLFERFYRTDNARNRGVGGSGLGLAIVKHIALVHGGQIEVSSVFGEGSVFTLRLPKSL